MNRSISAGAKGKEKVEREPSSNVIFVGKGIMFCLGPRTSISRARLIVGKLREKTFGESKCSNVV